MTRCYFHLKNSSRYVVKVVGTRGSDWGEIVNETHQPKEQSFTVVQSMGCPRAGTESDHWGEWLVQLVRQQTLTNIFAGWLYLMAHPVDDSNLTKYFTVFVRLRHSGDCKEMGMDWTYMKSDNEQPDYLPPRDMPSDGRENASKTFSPLGQLSW